MNYEEKRELRLQISQLLADAGLNKGVIKEMVEKEIANKVDQCINETLKHLDAQSSSGSYITDEVERYLKSNSSWYNIHDAVTKELKNRIINIKFSDKVTSTISSEPVKDYIVRYQVLVDGYNGNYVICSPMSLIACVKMILKGFLMPASKITIIKYAIKNDDDDKPSSAHICRFKLVKKEGYPDVSYDLEFLHERPDGTYKTIPLPDLYVYRKYPVDLVTLIEQNTKDIPLVDYD